jgi:hypothetical protein
MERVTWWKCVIAFIWCLIDDDSNSAEKKKEDDKNAEIQGYVGQCECKYDEINFE